MTNKKKYIIDNTQLMSEWNYKRNQEMGFEPTVLSFGSIQKVWWICEKGHEWQATPNNRSRGQGCPICAGRKVLSGYNDLASQLPNVANEWHPTLNDGLLPKEVTKRSNKRVWWKCKTCGSEWQTSVSNRTAGKGCPVCSKRKQSQSKIANIIAHKGSFADCYPDLLLEWDYSNNNTSPYNITKDSTKKAWWKCNKCGYSWQTTVSHRTVRGQGCPACSNKIVTENNCLSVTHPEILSKWNYHKNIDITPDNMTFGSNKKAWWKCENGHEWQATVTAIVSGGQCPVCCGQQVLQGYNDLQTVKPTLAKEWHPTKNSDIFPTQVTAGSSRVKVWWLCPKGHEYQSAVANRSRGAGCPICDKESKTSFPEQAIYYYVKKVTNAYSRYLFDNKTEIDVFLSDLNIGIEYDGLYFHSGESAKAKESRKNQILKDAGIHLFRVKETRNSNAVDTDNIIYCQNSGGNLFIEGVIKRLITKINQLLNISIAIDVDINRDSTEIYSQYIESEKANSLAIKRPDLAKEWHPTKNRFVKPDMVSYASGKKVWWLGKCGHEWQMSVVNRNKGSNCPYCSGRRVLVGFNDLVSTNPSLLNEWDFDKNKIFPEEVTAGSGKKVWWICDNGHSYSATISNRSYGKGCPYCSNIKVLKGYNDLEHLYPDLATEWDVDKNSTLPDSVTPGSNKKVWWKCSKCGHQWQNNPNHRVYRNSGCPACSGRVATESENLSVANPLLCKEWNYKRNDNLPSAYRPASSQKVWWLCSVCGFEWKTSISERSNGTGCPCCAGKIVVKGINDLKTIKPTLAKEWNVNRNDFLTPEMVTVGTNRKVWWKCSICNHEWLASVSNRNKGRGCPACGKKRTDKSKEKEIFQYDLYGAFICKYSSIKKAKEITSINTILPYSDRKKTSGGYIWLLEDNPQKALNISKTLNTTRFVYSKLPVLQYTLEGELIGKYSSSAVAETVNNISRSKVGECCRGKRKSAGGYIWKCDFSDTTK